jgi:hypothetical protein
MDSSIKFKILTSIASSNIDQDKKDVLVKYIVTLSEDNLVLLLSIFKKYPLSISMCADYIYELEKQDKPVPPEKFEEILTPILSMFA